MAALASLVAAPACAPTVEGGGQAGFDAEPSAALPLSAVTGVARSARGLIVGGVSRDLELFWDAWVVPLDGAAPRRLAPVGNDLVAIDASGALWTAITDYGASGEPSYQAWLSPADGSPAVLVSPALPPEFLAERAVADGAGGWLLAGSDGPGAQRHAAVYAVAAGGAVRRVASDPGAPPLFLDAALGEDALYLTVQHAPDGPAAIVEVPRR
jgi:hypothetical protein